MTEEAPRKKSLSEEKLPRGPPTTPQLFAWSACSKKSLSEKKLRRAPPTTPQLFAWSARSQERKKAVQTPYLVVLLNEIKKAYVCTLGGKKAFMEIDSMLQSLCPSVSEGLAE